MYKKVIGTKLEYIDKESKKVRLISIIDNKILINMYNGFYMLPGGKLDKDENILKGLQREIKEELGNDINPSFTKPFLEIENNLKNYPSRHHLLPINKKVTTSYYIYEGKIDLKKEKQLSDNEKNGEFETKYIDIAELKTLLSANNQTEKQRIHSHELLMVLDCIFEYYKLIDLHTHTMYSDGEHSPSMLIEKARKNNIGTIAITDHDTVLGLKEIDYEKYSDIKVIPGIELSIKRPFGRMHILGLNIDYTNQALLERLQEFKDNNLNNLKNIVRYLLNNGIEINEQDLEAIYHKIGNVGRPDIAKLLLKYGYVSSIQEAFDQYLIEAFNATRKNNKGITYDEAIKLILGANGIPILAHPNTLELNNEDFEALLQDMIEKGLLGLEVYHSNMSIDESQYYEYIVNKYNLLYSVGSDYHGENVKPTLALGYGKDNLYKINATVLKYLK